MRKLLIAIALCPPATLCSAADEAFHRDVEPFLKKHCYQCHDARQAAAGFRIDELGADFSVAKTPEMWREVIDRINIGDMPPEDEARPDPKESFAVVEWVGRELRRTEREAKMAGGRIQLRRLNRREYINTVRDLLLIDENFASTTLMEAVPPDGKAEGFDRVSAALFVDATQMDAYLEAASLISDEVIVSGSEPEAQKIVSESEDSTRKTKGVVKESLLGESFKIPAGVQKYEFKDNGVLHIQSHYGYDKGPKYWGKIFQSVKLNDLVTSDGYYRIRMKAGASVGSRGAPIKLKYSYADSTPVASEKIVELPHDLDDPDWVETVMFLRAGQPGQKRGLGISWNGIEKVIGGNGTWYKKIKNPSRVVTREIAAAKKSGDKQALKEAYAERDRLLDLAGKFNEPFFSYANEWAGREDEVPKLFVDVIEVSGPVHQSWPPASHQLLLGEETSADRTLAEARAAIEKLLPRAFRRPVQPGEVDRVLAIVQAGINQHGMNFPQAMRLGLQKVLCSPQFLYIAEPVPRSASVSDGVRELNDYELASRLSYFLWSTMPDEELFHLAEQGRLSDPKVLRSQVTRMLDDPKSQQFVESFAGQWLQVELFGSVQPGMYLYPDYDQSLEEASKTEALAFFAEILASNLAITNFLDSDFLVINERLAEHYGIKGVKGKEFRRVAIKPEHHRGGIFGMTGLMTLLADGTRTLPVRRAAWIVENLFNDPPPPPPPNAGEVQPNTKGENLTVRERLALHRDEPTCASCHAKLDPYGLALENYDAIGAWRTKANGENFRNPKKAPELDVSGQLPSGRKYSSLEEFKVALLAEKKKFAKAFSEKLLTYALSRPVGYVDYKTVDDLVAALEQNDYRIRPLIQAIVASEPFQTK
ncbi:DUF1592 domain-containing protein [Stratiformator vulcanicus]|uniref:Planctomycete cytochrome C n=1 Tax=Stratiformator vulcanicus TaxID=2527980 RepID=A0A517R5W4_9PLAN|nr:DUF1592 domain-containing protein [Stratiformator vulcanicus]QDT39278.1 hypothetical protein Pan189_36830 [Stratiformator vulcanicus]